MEFLYKIYARLLANIVRIRMLVTPSFRIYSYHLCCSKIISPSFPYIIVYLEYSTPLYFLVARLEIRIFVVDSANKVHWL